MKNTIFRKDKIVEYCKGKTVLHLGFIQHSLYEEKMKQNDWLHMKIDKLSTKLVGLDYLKKDIETIKIKYGYECYFADVMKLDKVELEDKFDVIVCGELIEHIENPGLMLDGIKKFMHKNSILVITTPNPWATSRIRLINNEILEEKWLNKEHVAWYSYETLKQLLQRKGFIEEIFDYYYGESTDNFNYSTNRLINILKKIRRNVIIKNTKKTNYDGLFFVCKMSG